MQARRKKALGWLISSAALFIGGYATGSIVSSDRYTPRAVYQTDLNGDERADLVVQSDARKVVFLSQEDGAYRSLHDVLAEAEKNAKAEAEKLRASIESKLELVDN